MGRGPALSPSEGIEAALEQAVAAADGADVSLAGGARTIQQYLQAGLVDELHIVISRVLLGGGERLFGDGLGRLEGYACSDLVSSAPVVHARITRRG